MRKSNVTFADGILGGVAASTWGCALSGLCMSGGFESMIARSSWIRYHSVSSVLQFILPVWQTAFARRERGNAVTFSFRSVISLSEGSNITLVRLPHWMARRRQC